MIFATGGLNATFGQGSGSSDFELTVKFDSAIPVAEVSAFYYKMSGNYFERIHVKKDSILNELILSGHNSYVHGVSFPTLVFEICQKVKYEVSGDSVSMTRQFFLFSRGAESYSDEMGLNFISFSMEQPNVLVHVTRRPNEFTVFSEDTNGLFTNTNFQHIFMGNELYQIDAN